MDDNNLTQEVMLCGHCGNTLQLKIKGEVRDFTHPDPDELTDFEIIWRILICPNCEKETIIRQEWFSEWDEIVYVGNSISHWIPNIVIDVLYPKSRRNFAHLPEAVEDSYRIALKLLPIEPIAFAVFIGRTLEFLCKDKLAKGRTLEAKIKDLAGREIIPSTLADMAQKLRIIRNLGVHTDQLEEISNEDALLLRELCEAILEYVYEAPTMLRQVEERFESVFSKPPPSPPNK